MYVKSLIAGLLLAFSAPAWADADPANGEARADDLAATGNLVCAEAFEMTAFTSPGLDLFNPTDSTSNQCSHQGANAPIARNQHAAIDAPRIITDATALARLPVGSTVARFVGSDPGDMVGTGYDIFLVGASQTEGALNQNAFNAQMAIRFYVYHSTDYNFRDDSPNQCHSKFLLGDPSAWHWENFIGPIHQYEFADPQWGPPSIFPRDCCWGVPGDTVSLTKANWKGHWFRVEAQIINRLGGAAPNGVRNILYMKDVTQGVTQVNGGQEFVAADWAGTDDGPDPWLGWNYITSNPRQKTMQVNLYREKCTPGASPPCPIPSCDGWRGISHMVVAGWDSVDLVNHRIGASTEFEGGGVAPTLTVVASASVSSPQNVPLVGATITGDPGLEGTGPNFRFKFYCDGTNLSDTQDVVDAVPGVASVSSDVGDCDSTFNVSGTYYPRVILEDYGAGAPGIAPILETATGTTTVIVNGPISQCPVEAPTTNSAITGFKLWDTNTNTEIDSDFNPAGTGEDVASADRSHVAVEAVGNAYLNTHGQDGSVLVTVDGTSHCENESPFASSSDNWPTSPTTFTADTVVGAIGTHTITAQAYDGANCQTPLGTAKTITFETLAP